MAWIIEFVNDHIVLNLRPYKSAHGVWEYLKKVNAQSNNAQRIQLEFELAQFSQDSRVVDEFYSSFSNFWIEYTNIIHTSVSHDL